jgi:cyanophycinase
MTEKNPKGTLAFIGGGEWSPLASGVDKYLLGLAPGATVMVLPTASAFLDPDGVVDAATACFASLGAEVEVLEVMNRRDAEDKDFASRLKDASFIYLSDGSPLHLRSVLKDSAVFKALLSAYNNGALIAASGAAATLLGDPMIDPRGGAFSIGLGLVEHLAILPHHGTAARHLLDRSLDLLPRADMLAGVDDHTALVRDSQGKWSVVGDGWVTLYTRTDGDHAVQIGSYTSDSVIEILTM